MKLLMAVYAIRFIIGLIDRKSKTNKVKAKDADHQTTKHPAVFQVR
jgi:hypothetical protein